ncbi:hypothetical protein SEA_HEATHEN_6 [Mycobacterium phage Heathen]|uniref:Uncharacterized protein n=2 Tax=Veracruzvirus heldan TaxID=1032892 RepID=A0A516KRG7_9CAUD|nr:hypothetical protein FGG19_gp06 [Mycobacterium phage HelDan]AEJ92001.1 hypothetical protein HELDAN_6 [Mycobacterium phage HelDan]QDP44287.1 hypothetical protein SEA_HEATHEN_6 [Mycobacterium phage Heathen]
MTTFIQFFDPSDPGVYYQIDPADFPDATTPEGQRAIEDTIAAVCPNVSSIMGIMVETVDYATVGEDSFPYRSFRMHTSLQDYFDSLSS